MPTALATLGEQRGWLSPGEHWYLSESPLHCLLPPTEALASVPRSPHPPPQSPSGLSAPPSHAPLAIVLNKPQTHK